MRQLLISLAAWLFASQLQAANVFKCIDAAGKVTFTQYQCDGHASSEEVAAPAAQRPSGDGPAVKIAKPSTLPAKPRKKRTYNHCGDLTQVDIAYAKGRGQIILGMTGADVREIWGSPTQVNRTASGDQWVYPIDEYRNRYLYVDTRGCFTYWN